MIRVLVSIVWLLAWGVLAIVVLRFPFGDDLQVTRYAGYVMPWLLVGLLPGAILAWLMRRPGLAILLGISATIILVMHAPPFRLREAPSRASAVRLKVMSYNVWTNNRDVSRIARVVLDNEPDVLLLQEIEPEVFARLVDTLQALHRGADLYRAYDHKFLQAVISRYPVVSQASLPEDGDALKVVLRSPAGPITVFNVHLERGDAWWHRCCQVASLLANEVLKETGPLILGGDFNAPDQSQPYRFVNQYLKNAHREAGRGFGFTYPSREVRLFDVIPMPPLVRIDHVFFSGHFIALRAGTTKDSGGSDHLPVFADLELEPARPDPAGRGARASAPAPRSTGSPPIVRYACP